MRNIIFSLLLIIQSFSFSLRSSPTVSTEGESTHEQFCSEVKNSNCQDLPDLFERNQSTMSKLDYDYLHYPIERCSYQYSNDNRLVELRNRLSKIRQEESEKRIALIEEERLKRNNEIIAKAQAESLSNIAENERAHLLRMANLEQQHEEAIAARNRERENALNAKNSYIKKERELAHHKNMIDNTRCADLEKLSEIYWDEFSALNLMSYFMAAVDHCCKQDPYNSDLYAFKETVKRKCENSTQAQKYKDGKGQGRVEGASVGAIAGGLIGFLLRYVIK